MTTTKVPTERGRKLLDAIHELGHTPMSFARAADVTERTVRDRIYTDTLLRSDTFRKFVKAGIPRELLVA